MEISYKPGWRILLEYSSQPGMVEVLVVAKVPDVASGEPIDVALHRVYPTHLRREELLKAIYFQVLELERHEASEQFRVDGVAIFNEHDLAREQRLQIVGNG